MNVLLPIILLTTAILAAEDPCDCKKARDDMDGFIKKKLDSWSEGQLKKLGSNSKACRELTTEQVEYIAGQLEKSDKPVWEVLHYQCIADMAHHNSAVFDDMIKELKEYDDKEKKKRLNNFLNRENGYYCKNMSSFKDTDIYDHLKKNCKHVETAAELASVKKENEALKKELETKKPDTKPNSASSLGASIALGLASAILYYALL